MEHINDVWKNFCDEGIKQEEQRTKFFKIQPVSPKVFFTEWIPPALSDEQLKAVNSLFEMTEDGLVWNKEYMEYLLLWGEGGGKDFTCSRLLTYCAYYLMCMSNPQGYFGIAENEPIDIINVSINAQHARNVFFHKFSTAVKRVVNPKTGNNWFEEQGVDLRDGQDVQSTMIKFGNSVRAHSLHSEKYAGEGLNVLLAVFDEVGEFKPQRAKELYEALWHTETSRYGNKFKMLLISYMRDPFDFMMYRWEQTKKSTNVYRSMKSTWEVNPLKKREDFQLAYDKNPEEASRRFENKNIAGSGNRFFKYQERIREYANKDRISPIVNNPKYVSNLLGTQFHPWFKPNYTKEMYDLSRIPKHILTKEQNDRLYYLLAQHQYSKYYIHIDLAKADADAGQDCAGFAMVHPYLSNPIDEMSVVGVYVDLAIQLRVRGGELNFENIRKFIYDLYDKKFIIDSVTLDGWQSLDFCQLLTTKGIKTEVLSVDRSFQPYNTLKEQLYTRKLDYYEYIILMRELEELIQENGKIDHPDISNRRANEEGTDKGSKDVADAVAGATYMAIKSTTIVGGGWYDMMEGVDD
jgi:hypothetical protein